MSIATVVAPAHIPVLQNMGYSTTDDYNIPINDSIGVTLDFDTMCAKATVIASSEFKENKIFINGREETMANVGLYRLVNAIKQRADPILMGECWLIKVHTENNFDEDLGLDSKAAEYAAFATALAKAYEIDGDVSDAVRMAYGPACLSMYGGIVKWYKTSFGDDNVDSCSKPILDVKHWPDLRILILVVDGRKSDNFHNRSDEENSDYAMKRIRNVMPSRATDMCEAVYYRRFDKFAEMIMKESNMTHATYMIDHPPKNYLNDVSRGVIELVHSFNAVVGETVVAYTFGKDPNPRLLIMEKDLSNFLGVLNHYYPPPLDCNVVEDYFKGFVIGYEDPSPQFLRAIQHTRHLPGKFKYILQTSLSMGPRIVSDL